MHPKGMFGLSSLFSRLTQKEHGHESTSGSSRSMTSCSSSASASSLQTVPASELAGVSSTTMEPAGAPAAESVSAPQYAFASGAPGFASVSLPQSGSGPGSGSGSNLVGFATIELLRCGKEMAKALGCKLGTCAVLVSNMAVDEEKRNMGVAKRVMQECEQVGYGFKPQPSMMCLLVYKSNPAAISVYHSCGYEEVTGWLDPRWVYNADRGIMGAPRRLLYAKPRPGVVLGYKKSEENNGAIEKEGKIPVDEEAK
eukprot:gene5135-34941_t